MAANETESTPGLLTLVWPTIVAAELEVANAATALALDPASVLPDLMAQHRERQVRIVERAMAIEIQAAGLRGQLAGDTPEARYASFIERLGVPDVRSGLLAEYPGLARQSTDLARQWSGAVHEVLVRCCRNDRVALEQIFGGLGRLTSVTSAQSDPHHDGRMVMVCAFESGTRLVYKPRSLGVDAHFQELVTWLNHRGLTPPQRRLTLLDCGTHGWMEWVSAAPCDSVAALERFHERQGAWLAIMHAVAGTDLHFENLLAAGEHPVPIDLETVFHARVFPAASTNADESARSRLDESVHGVGLLPSPTWDGGAAQTDLSGMGSGFEESDVVVVPAMVDAGTDAMRYGDDRVEPPRQQNRPRIDGAPGDARAHGEAVERGFIAAYRLLESERETLLSEVGPLSRFAQDTVRLVIRPTRWYTRLLRDREHPQQQLAGANVDWLASHLDRHAAQASWRQPFLRSEQAQLERGDVPYFSTHVDGADVRGGDGMIAADTVIRSGMTVAHDRIRALGDQDLAEQLWVIRATLATKAYGRPIAGRPMPDASALELAIAVGDRLLATAAGGPDGLSWLGLVLVGSADPTRDVYRPDLVGSDLYDGLAGIALFLAQLGETTGVARYSLAAEATLRTLHAREPHHAHLIGAFAGLGGLVLLWTRLGIMWDRPALLDRADAVAERITELAGQDRILDVVAGSAGAVHCLLALDAVRPAGPARAAAVACGERLLAAAPDWTGLPMHQGLSHGPSGIAWALAELAHITDDPRCAAAAGAVLDPERALIASGVWTDHDIPGQPSMAAWCHGAPGIALARLAGWRSTGDPALRTEAEHALRVTLDAGLLPSHGLCHGDLGNLDVLLIGAETLADDPVWRTAADTRTGLVLDSMHTNGWRCSPPRGLETPGLMTGLAGIGYGLLRIAAPHQVPSVLTLLC